MACCSNYFFLHSWTISLLSGAQFGTSFVVLRSTEDLVSRWNSVLPICMPPKLSWGCTCSYSSSSYARMCFYHVSMNCMVAALSTSFFEAQILFPRDRVALVAVFLIFCGSCRNVDTVNGLIRYYRATLRLFTSSRIVFFSSRAVPKLF